MPEGAWVAYHGDFSGFVIFDKEIEALRYAVENSMMVAFIPFGQDVRKWINDGGPEKTLERIMGGMRGVRE